MDNQSIISYKIIRTRNFWVRLNFVLSSFLLILMEAIDLDTIGELYLLYSLWNLFLYTWLLFSEQRVLGLNILTIFFAGALLGVVSPSISYSMMLIKGEKILLDYDYNDITRFVFRTTVAMNICYSVFVVLLTKFTQNRLFVVDIQYIVRRFNVFYLSLIVYLISTVLRIVPFLEMISSTLANLANNLPMLVLLILAIYNGTSKKHDKHFALFIILLFVEILYNMFFGYYKSPIARVTAMYIIYYYLYCRTNNKKLISVNSIFLASLFILFLLYIIYPFITIKRLESGYTAANDKTAILKVDNVDILKRVITGNYQIFDDNDTSGAFTDRMSSVSANAFFYQDAYNHGFHDDMLIFSLKKMVPGFLWAGKPEGSPGMIAKNYIVAKSLDKDATSAAFVGLFASSYFWGGWLAVLLMCIINSWILALLLNACFENMGNLFSWVVIFFIIFLLLRNFEETCDGGAGQCILFLIYTFIIKFTSKISFALKTKY